MHGFATRWRNEHLGEWFNAPKLSGFCLLRTRDVYDTIGGLDERFGIGFFDDDDLAERARRAGFELAVAHDLFVHHFGSRTFAGNGVDADALVDENASRFAEKWRLRETNGRRVVLRPWQGAANGVSPPRETGFRQRPETARTQTRSASEGLYPRPTVLSPPTRSASEGLYPQPTVLSPPTRSTSDGFSRSAAEASRHADGGPGLSTGPLAGASGWGANRSEGKPALAGASGWCALDFADD